MLLKRFVLLIIAVSCGGVLSGFAQTPSVLTGGLNHPNRIVTGAGNSLIVTEAGTAVSNTGRISIIDRDTGVRRTLIGNLPSAVSYLGGPAGDADGPSGLLLRGQTLYVTIGVGDAVVPGPGQGLESPNPGTPSSPIFDSLLEVSLPKNYASLPSGFTMTSANQAALASGSNVVLVNANGHEMSVRMVANLPDYRSDPRPGNPNNVKASHLYGVEIFQKNLYVVDAGHNLIHRVSLSSGAESVLVVFPNRPNPAFPFGGPFIEAVPDNIHRFGNHLLIPLLTGFPFLSGMAEVRSIDLMGGENNGLISGLTSAIDVLKVETDDDNAYYTLEFSTDMLHGGLGRLRYYSSPHATPINVITTLVTPTSMARDDDDGNIFITNTALGMVTKVSFPITHEEKKR